MQFRTKYFMMSISTTLFGEILHANLFFTGQLRNPWQMLVEPWGSVEPRLKITAVTHKLPRVFVLNFHFAQGKKECCMFINLEKALCGKLMSICGMSRLYYCDYLMYYLGH